MKSGGRAMKAGGGSMSTARKDMKSGYYQDDMGMRGGAMYKKANGGSAMAGKKKFPDLTGDGKVTRADVLKGRGVFSKGGRATSVMGRGQGKVIKHKKTIMV
jgi:hypothetical protein